MGTTLTLAYSVGSDLFVAHAGDSRCYVFRDGELFQLTNDHTKERALAQQGDVPLSPAMRRRFSHVITNLVGGHEPGVEAEVHKTSLQHGDVLLLATDGLSRHVSDHEIAAILDAEAAPQAACEQLVQAALNGGGRDNITVIVARYEA
jgi:serine/threonine protein phosphatase PrpC